MFRSFGNINKWREQIIYSKFEFLHVLWKKKERERDKDTAIKTHKGTARNQKTYMKKSRRNVLWSWHTMEIYRFKSDELYIVPGHLLLNKFNMREQAKESWTSKVVYIRLSAGHYKWRGMFRWNKIMNAGIQAVLLKTAIVGISDMECKSKTVFVNKHTFFSLRTCINCWGFFGMIYSWSFFSSW